MQSFSRDPIPVELVTCERLQSPTLICSAASAKVKFQGGPVARRENRHRLLWVGSISSSHAEAVAGTANRVSSGLRQPHLKQRPFVAAPVAGPNGRSVSVSVSTPAGDHRQHSLQTGCTRPHRDRRLRVAMQSYALRPKAALQAARLVGTKLPFN